MLNLLFEAVKDNDVVKVRKLINEESDVNARMYNGRTALMIAAENNSAEIAKLLIDASADVDARDNSGRTALEKTASGDSTEVAKLLIDAVLDDEQERENIVLKKKITKFKNRYQLSKQKIEFIRRDILLYRKK